MPETTANALGFAIYQISKNPHVEVSSLATPVASSTHWLTGLPGSTHDAASCLTSHALGVAEAYPACLQAELLEEIDAQLALIGGDAASLTEEALSKVVNNQSALRKRCPVLLQ